MQDPEVEPVVSITEAFKPDDVHGGGQSPASDSTGFNRACSPTTSSVAAATPAAWQWRLSRGGGGEPLMHRCRLDSEDSLACASTRPPSTATACENSPCLSSPCFSLASRMPSKAFSMYTSCSSFELSRGSSLPDMYIRGKTPSASSTSRLGRVKPVTCEDYAGAYGALPHLPRAQFKGGESLPRMPLRCIPRATKPQKRGPPPQEVIDSWLDKSAERKFSVTRPKEETIGSLSRLRQSGWSPQAPPVKAHWAEGPHPFCKPWRDLKEATVIMASNRNFDPPPPPYMSAADKITAAIAAKKAAQKAAKEAEAKPKEEPPDPAPAPDSAAAGDEATAADAASDEGAPKKKKKELETRERELTTLMLNTLADESDNVFVLQERLVPLEQCLAEVGGSKHATVNVSLRTISVIREKHARLAKLKQRSEDYNAARRDRIQLLQAIMKGAEPNTLRPETHGFRKFLEKVVDPGDPREQERGNFQIFLKTFGLPKEHKLIKQAYKDLKSGEEEFEVDACEMAVKAVSELVDHTNFPTGELIREKHARDRAQKLFNMREMISLVGSLSEKFPVIQKLKDLEKKMTEHAQALRFKELNQIARNLLDQVTQEIGVDTELRNKLPKDGGGKAAYASADRVKSLIGLALERGVPKTHDDMVEAFAGYHSLLAEGIRRNALAYQYQDEKTYAEKGWVEGFAFKLAETVEKEVSKVKDMGVPLEQDNMKAARELAKQLRDAEGFRKRDFVAAKKKAEQDEKDRKKREEEEMKAEIEAELKRKEEEKRHEEEKRKQLGLPNY
eukprot:TRINITY_DN34871_c0_g1_i1.p1 TRINITY_DN34871_c0_g1~~TRINITY_DN34871_c0_g1_i1.p1  ORF type:complete len:788 (+),score=208.46 TRINITY_DN34871_c0_g1_i1:243-2606(+)